MPVHKPSNPFYVALLPIGVLFAITACAFGVMTVRGLEPGYAGQGGLIGLMDQHGLKIMFAELAMLSLLTIAAIASDGYWMRGLEGHQTSPSNTTNESQPLRTGP